jgi:uracil phosphoribosyltransferase
MRFRTNLERIGRLLGYEISKELEYTTRTIETPLAHASARFLSKQPVLATVLRAGLALHHGLLEVFDRAESAFISAFRKHDPDGSFIIQPGYTATPQIAERVLIVSDPMLATGASLVLALNNLIAIGTPKAIHIVSAIASTIGVEHVQRTFPDIHIWAAAIDPELDENAYIVPGLGDAGDLAYGKKIQS